MSQQKFGIDEAVQFVLELGCESELSELEESDFVENTDITFEVLPRICEVEEEIEEEETEEEEEEEVIIYNEQNSVSLESENECKKGVKNKKYEYRWKSTNLPEINTTFVGKVFNIPPDDVDTFTHLNYFQFFWKNSLHEVFAEQTNYTACRKLVKV